MNADLFDQYEQLLASGRRSEAGPVVRAFIDSFESSDEKAEWTRWFLENRPFEGKIRHELYEEVIFPVLLQAYRDGDAWSTWWLARTEQNFCQNKAFREAIGRKGRIDLLKELLALEPGHEKARLELLGAYLQWLSYLTHEWPAGLCYNEHQGRQGPVTVEECDEILEEIQYARKLDAEGKHAKGFDEDEQIVREYRSKAPHQTSSDGDVVAWPAMRGLKYRAIQDGNYMATFGFESEEHEPGDLANIRPLTPESARLFWSTYFKTGRRHVMQLDEGHWARKLEWQDIGNWFDDYNADKPERVRQLLSECVDWLDYHLVYYCQANTCVIEANWGTFLKYWMNFLMFEDEGPILFNPHNPHVLAFMPRGGIQHAVRW